MADFDLLTIGGNFPPGLNTADPPTDLKADETPDGYGFDLSKDGRIAKGTIPSGTARVQKSVTLAVAAGAGEADTPFLREYHRLWNITGNTKAGTSNILLFGAQHYDDYYFPQGLGKIPFDEDANPILCIIPFGGDSMFIGKASGGYVLSNLSDGRAFFQRTGLIQEMLVSTAARATELNGRIYTCNASGLLEMRSNGEVTEVTRKVRDGLTNFANKSLTCDYAKGRVIGASTFAYEPATEKIFRYSGSAFRYTTPQVHRKDYEPFFVDRLFLVVEHGDDSAGEFTYQVQYEDDGWLPALTVAVTKTEERFTLVPIVMEQARAARRFQFRLTNITGAKYVREVKADIQQFRLDDYAV